MVRWHKKKFLENCSFMPFQSSMKKIKCVPYKELMSLEFGPSGIMEEWQNPMANQVSSCTLPRAIADFTRHWRLIPPNCSLTIMDCHGCHWPTKSGCWLKTLWSTMILPLCKEKDSTERELNHSWHLVTESPKKWQVNLCIHSWRYPPGN